MRTSSLNMSKYGIDKDSIAISCDDGAGLGQTVKSSIFGQTMVKS